MIEYSSIINIIYYKGTKIGNYLIMKEKSCFFWKKMLKKPDRMLLLPFGFSMFIGAWVWYPR